MPYKTPLGGFEHASTIGHVPVVGNSLIRERLRLYRIAAQEPLHDLSPDLIVPAEALPRPTHRHRWVLSFDGSPQEVAVRSLYPRTRLGYVQIAGVLLDLQRFGEQEKQSLVDPSALRLGVTESCYSAVLPGSNVCSTTMATVRDSWREGIYQIFKEHTIEGMSLFDVFLLLMKQSNKWTRGGRIMLARCSAVSSCAARAIAVSVNGNTCTTCGGKLYPTDVLRLHEEITEEQTNATALGRLMTCLEHFTMLGYIHLLAEQQPSQLSDVAFVLDGPLALFGPLSWLHTSILNYLGALKAKLVAEGRSMPIIVGIEKGGQFADHAHAIQRLLPPATLMRLPDWYIYKHIITFRAPPNSPFGIDTYYGQKWIYKTTRGEMVVFTIPQLPEDGVASSELVQYPLLPDTLALLDRLGTRLYLNGLMPIALAHHYASIPRHIGSRVLKLLAQESLGNA